MQRNHLYHLFFVLVVLFSVAVGGAREPALRKPEPLPLVSQKVNQSEKTALTASIETALTASAPLPPPEISAASALVKSLFSKEAVFNSHPNKQWPAASLTKLMTAVVALDRIPPQSQIPMSYKAVATEGAAGNFIVGKNYSRDDVLKSLLVYSSNDAAAALAEFYDHDQDLGGRSGGFVEEMNAKAASLGMYNTRFFDPHGLSPLNQSTANDLERLVHHIFNIRPEIFSWTRIRDGNTHPFVSRENFIGGKTGFLNEAGGNLITLVDDRGRFLVIIVLGSENRAGDTENLYKHYAQ